jgi:hypothetical protein
MNTLNELKEYISKSVDFADYLTRINLILDYGYTAELTNSDRREFKQFALAVKMILKKKFEDSEPDSTIRNLILLQRVYDVSISDYCDELLTVLNEKEKFYNKLKSLINYE